MLISNMASSLETKRSMVRLQHDGTEVSYTPTQYIHKVTALKPTKHETLNTCDLQARRVIPAGMNK
jgi:hypothetical protein